MNTGRTTPVVPGVSMRDPTASRPAFAPLRVAIVLLVALLPVASSGREHADTERSAVRIPSTPGWFPIPNTRMRDVCPPDNFKAYDALFGSRCHNVVNTWNGGAIDTLRSRLIIWGGGHLDYAGNELYALDLMTFTFKRLTDPSPLNPSTAQCAETRPDANPNDRHTYDGLAYIEHADRLFAFSGALGCGDGHAGQDTWTFDFKTLKWQNMRPAGAVPRGRQGIVTAYDPNTKKVFVHNREGLYAYTFETNNYEVLSSATYIDYRTTAAIDPKRKKLVIVGGPSSNKGGVRVYDIGPGTRYKSEVWVTTGGEAIVNSNSPGLGYDPVADRMVAWNGGDTVYTLNMESRVWTAITYAGGPGPAPETGMFSRWDYVPKLSVFVAVNSVDHNAYLFRLGPPSGRPAPTRTEPASNAR